jgi:hypothetical protein
MDYYNVTSEINLNNANTGADMQANTNTAISNNATTGANMQATQPYSVISGIQVINQQLKNFEARLVINKSASDKQLYVILGDVFDICTYLKNPVNAAVKADFTNYCKDKFEKKYDADKLTSYVLQFCFDGLDSDDINVRKKIYTYKTVINFAIEKGVLQGGFVSFLNEMSGLENARKEKYKQDREKSGTQAAPTVTQQAQTYVEQKPMSVIAESDLQANLPSTPVGQPFVLVATRLTNGRLAINASTTEAAALAAALRGIFKEEKAVIKAYTPTPRPIPQPSTPPALVASEYSTEALSNDEVDSYGYDFVEAAIAKVPEFAA